MQRKIFSSVEEKNYISGYKPFEKERDYKWEAIYLIVINSIISV